MHNLYIINIPYSNNYQLDLLNVIFITSILCGILVIISKNPVISILYLIGLFASISCYLIILGLNFIGLSYLIIYIGAVSILFLFILMLINVRISELQNNTSNSIVLASIVIIFFNFTLSYNYLVNNTNDINYIDTIWNNIKILFSDRNTTFVTSKIWDGNIIENNHLISIGNTMYTSYNIWLIMASLVLLLAMVGAIIITIEKK
jgi:NADH-ubiquinone oxidoreductase chain 6